jgi:hypothetical protein
MLTAVIVQKTNIYSAQFEDGLVKDVKEWICDKIFYDMGYNYTILHNGNINHSIQASLWQDHAILIKVFCSTFESEDDSDQAVLVPEMTDITDKVMQ